MLDASRKSAPSEVKSHADLNIVPIAVLDIKSILKICEQAVSEKMLEMGTSMIRIHLYNEVTGDFKVFCESLSLTRIISNLLNNSIESIADKGFISLTLSGSPEGLFIEVRDNGKGMSDELIAKVFDGPVSEGKARGNGLGLWSAIEQVRSWQGDFQIHSSSGTTISIFLKNADITV